MALDHRRWVRRPLPAGVADGEYLQLPPICNRIHRRGHYHTYYRRSATANAKYAWAVFNYHLYGRGREGGARLIDGGCPPQRRTLLPLLPRCGNLPFPLTFMQAKAAAVLVSRCPSHAVGCPPVTASISALMYRLS